ncbi:MAG TPA: DUF1571 domain-containing protein [bacterium (Candidatus Stahlbacteria)]|nr:DUF1571 domain-containing protein [Candidatus Stahlbacteria bacterium]
MVRVIILLECLILSAPVFAEVDSLRIVVDAFKQRWDSLTTYTLTHYSHVVKGRKVEDRVYDYKFMKPKWIYMKVIEGKNKGAAIVYNPETRMIRGHKGGILSLIKLTLKPTDRRVVSIRGHRADETDFGAILSRLTEYVNDTLAQYKGIDKVDNTSAWVIEANGLDSFRYYGAVREVIWIGFDGYPLKFEHYNKDGTLIYRVIYKNLKVDIPIDPKTFKL